MRLYLPFVAVLVAIAASPCLAITPVPTITIPDDVVGPLDGVAMAPVQIDDATGLFGFDFIINYDTVLLDLADADVRLGPVGAGFAPTIFVQDGIGQINVSGYTTTALTGGSGNLLELDFRVASAPGVSPVSIAGTLNDNPTQFNPGTITTVVPEPSTMVALLGGLLLLVSAVRRRSR